MNLRLRELRINKHHVLKVDRISEDGPAPLHYMNSLASVKPARKRRWLGSLTNCHPAVATIAGIYDHRRDPGSAPSFLNRGYLPSCTNAYIEGDVPRIPHSLLVAFLIPGHKFSRALISKHYATVIF